LSECESCNTILQEHAASREAWDNITSGALRCFEGQDCTAPTFDDPDPVVKEELTFHEVTHIRPCVDINCSASVFGQGVTEVERKKVGKATCQCVPACVNTSLHERKILNLCDATEGMEQSIITCSAHPHDTCRAVNDGNRETMARLQHGSSFTISYGRKHSFTEVNVFWPPTSNSNPSETSIQDAVVFNVECLDHGDGSWHEVLSDAAHPEALVAGEHRFSFQAAGCPSPSAVWRFQALTSAEVAWANVWDVKLTGGNSSALNVGHELKPMTECGFVTEQTNAGIEVSWNWPDCHEKGLSVFCKGSITSSHEFTQHVPDAHQCGEVTDGNPSTLTAFQAHESFTASITFQQLGASNKYDSYTHAFIYKHASILESRQLNSFVLHCGEQWSQEFSTETHPNWASTSGWITMEFERSCNEMLITLSDMKATVENQLLYILEVRLATDGDQSQLPQPLSRKIEGHCIHHQTLPPFQTARELKLDVADERKKYLIAEFVPDLPDQLPAGSDVKVQLQIPRVTTLLYGKHGWDWSGPPTSAPTSKPTHEPYPGECKGWCFGAACKEPHNPDCVLEDPDGKCNWGNCAGCNPCHESSTERTLGDASTTQSSYPEPGDIISNGTSSWHHVENIAQGWGHTTRKSPLEVAIYGGGLEIMGRNFIGNFEDFCSSRCKGCGGDRLYPSKTYGVYGEEGAGRYNRDKANTCAPPDPTHPGMCFDAASYHCLGDECPALGENPFNCTTNSRDSGFQVLTWGSRLSATNAKAKLVLPAGLHETNMGYSLEGAIIVTYWIKYPEDVECAALDASH